MTLLIWAITFLYVLVHSQFFFSNDFVNFWIHTGMNSILGIAFICFEVLNFFDTYTNDKFSKYKHFGTYADIFQKTISTNFQKIKNIRATLFAAFLLINLLLLCFNQVLNSVFFIGFYLGFMSINFDLAVCFASKKERDEYFSICNKEYLSFSKTGVVIVVILLIIAGILLFR